MKLQNLEECTILISSSSVTGFKKIESVTLSPKKDSTCLSDLGIPLANYYIIAENFPCFCVVFFIQETGIIGSVEAWWILQCHISFFYLKQIALKCQKPLAGEKQSFISSVFRILQNNWLPHGNY